MSDNQRHSAKIAIVGGGISGVATALRLAQAGYVVTVFESSTLGHSATLRNQGWLHSGAYFAKTNLELCRICYTAMQQTMKYCPEAIEPNSDGMIYAAIESKSRQEDWLSAWETAGIPHHEVSDDLANNSLPLLDKSKLKWMTRLPDRAFNAEILLNKLANEAREAGVLIHENCSVTNISSADAVITSVTTGNDNKHPCDIVVIASGSDSLQSSFGYFTTRPGQQPDYQLVNLKTHLYATQPAIPGAPFCIVDGSGLNHLPHEQTSIFGNNKWNVSFGSVRNQREENEVELIVKAIHGLYPNGFGISVKEDSWAGTNLQAMRVDQITPGVDPFPTVIDHANQPFTISNLISIFPGRATMWSVIADTVLDLVLEKTSGANAAK